MSKIFVTLFRIPFLIRVFLQNLSFLQIHMDSNKMKIVGITLNLVDWLNYR